MSSWGSVLADPNLLIMPDYMVVECYVIEKWNIFACYLWSELKFLEGMN